MAIGFNVKQFKEGFFTTPGLEALLAPGEKQALSKFGGYLRRVARNSLEYGDGPGAPGQPPKVHEFFNRQKTNRKTGAVTTQSVSPLKELLFYAYDAETKSVVVGPALFGGSSKRHRSSKTVPATLEAGGTVRIERDEVVKVAARSTPRQRESFLRKIKDGSIRRKPVAVVTKVENKRYSAHPFMAPAMTKSLPKFSSYFAGIQNPGGNSGGV